ncbi:hypothetical protein KFE98_14545 [bacterium SCSIO 12741]|nr:hypothetical protein KFE98_14545 [bacterium SCSIO 12741]
MMTKDEQIKDLDKRVKWVKKHLTITFLLSLVTFAMLVGHFILHATGRLPH